MNASDTYFAMAQIIGLGAASLKEGRREQWQPAIDELHSMARAWYRERLESSESDSCEEV